MLLITFSKSYFLLLAFSQALTSSWAFPSIQVSVFFVMNIFSLFPLMTVALIALYPIFASIAKVSWTLHP